jgi:hypothetical protein
MAGDNFSYMTCHIAVELNVLPEKRFTVLAPSTLSTEIQSCSTDSKRLN